jgi:hypothetical protein
MVGRRGFFASIILMFSVVASTAAAASNDKRVALVVANSHYQFVPALGNTINDALLIARTLQRLGFSLVGGGAQLDLNEADFKKAVAAFGNQITGSDVALFYFAGHGLQAQGANFLVPIDANPVKPSDVDLQLVDTKIVLDQMEDSGANLKVVILDACRNNPFGGRSLRDMSRGLAVMPAPRGTLISYATQPGNVAGDGPAGGDSPFTLALADALIRPGIDALNMFNEVGLIVDRVTNGVQQPWLATSPINGKFYFSGRPTEPEVAIIAPPVASSVAAGREPPVNSDRDVLEARVMFPAHIPLAQPSGATSDTFLGEWYGISSPFAQPYKMSGVAGREMIFAIQSIYGDKVVAIEAFGAAPSGMQQAQAMTRTGQLQGRTIDFREPGAAPMTVTLQADGTLQIQTAGVRATAANLHRIAP